MNEAAMLARSNDASAVKINSYQQQPTQEQQNQTFLLVRSKSVVKYSNKRCNCKCSKKTETAKDTSAKIMQNSKIQLLEKQQQQQQHQVEELLLYQQHLFPHKSSQQYNDDSNFKISIDCCRRKQKYPLAATTEATVVAVPLNQTTTIEQLLSTAAENCDCFSNARSNSKSCCSSKLYSTSSTCSAPIRVPTTSKTLQPKALRKINKSGCSTSSNFSKNALFLFATTAKATVNRQELMQQRQQQQQPQKLQKVVAMFNGINFLKVSILLLMLLLLLFLSKATLYLTTAIAFSCTSLLLQQQSLQCARRNAFYSFLLISLLYAQLLSLTPQTLGSNGGGGNVINASNIDSNSNSGGGSSSALLALEMAFGNSVAVIPPLPNDDDDDEQQQASGSSNSNRLFNTEAKHRAPDALLLAGDSGGNIVSLITREQLLERAHNSGSELAAAATVLPQVTENAVDAHLHSSSSSCHSCRQVREKAKQDNLESIKNHILMRLKLSKPPNITSPIQVPPNILEDFYKNYGAGGTTVRRKISKTVGYEDHSSHERHHYHEASFKDVSSSSSTADSADMQGDDPLTYSKPQLLSEMDYAGSSKKTTNNLQWNFEEELVEEEEFEEDDFEEEFYSRVKSIYVFPTSKYFFRLLCIFSIIYYAA